MRDTHFKMIFLKKMPFLKLTIGQLCKCTKIQYEAFSYCWKLTLLSLCVHLPGIAYKYGKHILDVLPPPLRCHQS